MSRGGWIPDRLKAVVKAAEAAGWTYDRTRKDHPRLSPPRGLEDPITGRLQAPVLFASTPSDHRGDRNSRAALRRAGVDC
jgi:hypothetical protein